MEGSPLRNEGRDICKYNLTEMDQIVSKDFNRKGSE